VKLVLLHRITDIINGWSGGSALTLAFWGCSVRVTGYLDGVFDGFPQSLQANSGIVLGYATSAAFQFIAIHVTLPSLYSGRP
jgi:hypothetical protein